MDSLPDAIRPTVSGIMMVRGQDYPHAQGVARQDVSGDVVSEYVLSSTPALFMVTGQVSRI